MTNVGSAVHMLNSVLNLVCTGTGTEVRRPTVKLGGSKGGTLCRLLSKTLLLDLNKFVNSSINIIELYKTVEKHFVENLFNFELQAVQCLLQAVPLQNARGPHVGSKYCTTIFLVPTSTQIQLSI